MRRTIPGLVFLVMSAALAAERPPTLLDHIQNSGLPSGQRDELAHLLAAKDFAGMEAVLEHPPAAESPPVAAERHALAGAVEFLEGQMYRAAQSFRVSDSLAPLDDTDRFTWAMALVRLGDAKSAREQLMRLDVAHPDNPFYLYWLARIDYTERLYGPAIEKLRRVIRIDPQASRAYDNLGLAFDMMGQFDEARDAFVKAVDLNRSLSKPSAWPPHNLGYLLLRLQQPKEAENALRESLKYDPGFATAHYHLGRTLEAEGRDDEAIGEYRVAISLDNALIEPLYSLGLLYRRQGRKAEADAAFVEYKSRKSQSAAH